MKEKVKLKSVYIAGPMRGYPNLNFPAFDSAQKQWESWGWRVYSPAAVDRALSVKDEGVANQPEELRRIIQLDTLLICNADAIALLPRWRGSFGATVELALAQLLQLSIFDAMSGKPLLVESIPWAYVESIHNALQDTKRHDRL